VFPKLSIRDFVERGFRFEDALDAWCPPDSDVEWLAMAIRRRPGRLPCEDVP